MLAFAGNLYEERTRRTADALRPDSAYDRHVSMLYGGNYDYKFAQ